MKKLFFLIATTMLVSLQANEWIFDYVKTTPNFPIPGVQFKSYGPLMNNPEAFKRMIKIFADRYRDSGVEVIAGLDARGFIFGTALAYELNLPFVMVRKAGKLPGDVVTVHYDLEYGKAAFEIDRDSLKPGQKVLIIDDLIATGGTVKAAGQLIEQLQAQVFEVACLIELTGLKGRDKIPYPIFSLLTVE